MSHHIVGLDIGSHTIKAAVAEVKPDGGLLLIKLITAPSEGIRRGVVDDAANATRALNQVIEEIKQISKNAVRNLYISVGSGDMRVQHSRGIVAVSRADFEICSEDVERVLQAAQAVNLPPNRMILHAVTKEYVVDSVADIRNPVGMTGNRLEAQSLIIDAFSPTVKSIVKCVEVAGGKVAGLIFSPLASSHAVLSRNQKELGVMLVDIGFSKTGISVYEENKLLHAAVIPLGSGNITNDIAIGVKTSIDIAEMIKIGHGSAIAHDVAQREVINLEELNPMTKGVVRTKFVSEIIEGRLAEIFELIHLELKKINRDGKLPAGVVLVGGGAKMPNIVELARQELRLPAHLALPDLASFERSSEMGFEGEDPHYACVFGLVMWAHELNHGRTRVVNWGGGMKGIIKKLFGYFIP